MNFIAINFVCPLNWYIQCQKAIPFVDIVMAFKIYSNQVCSLYLRASRLRHNWWINCRFDRYIYKNIKSKFQFTVNKNYQELFRIYESILSLYSFIELTFEPFIWISAKQIPYFHYIEIFPNYWNRYQICSSQIGLSGMLY